jgi:transposase
MSFQAYLDTIKAKTGKNPKDFMMLMKKRGIFSPDMKASALVSFLAKEFKLGHGHSMAVWAVFKDEGWVKSPKK